MFIAAGRQRDLAQMRQIEIGDLATRLGLHFEFNVTADLQNWLVDFSPGVMFKDSSASPFALSLCGRGTEAASALSCLAREISGKILILNFAASSPERKEFQLPSLVVSVPGKKR